MCIDKGDYETDGRKDVRTGLRYDQLYEVSCEELDFLNGIARECGVTGSRVMGGGFGGCTINLVKDELYKPFIDMVQSRFPEKFGRAPKIYDVVIGDGSRKLED